MSRLGPKIDLNFRLKHICLGRDCSDGESGEIVKVPNTFGIFQVASIKKISSGEAFTFTVTKVKNP